APTLRRRDWCPDPRGPGGPLPRAPAPGLSRRAEVCTQPRSWPGHPARAPPWGAPPPPPALPPHFPPRPPRAPAPLSASPPPPPRLSGIFRDRGRQGPSALVVHAVPDASEVKLPLTLLFDLVSGQHRQHSRLLPGSRGIDPTEVGVGVRAAEHGHVRHAAE